MEKYVKSLYDRLNQENKMKLIIIMENAIEEARREVFCKLSPASDMFGMIHDPDPNVRLAAKAASAKQIAGKFKMYTTQVPQKEGALVLVVGINYCPKFVNSICLCIQECIEDIRLSGKYRDKTVFCNIIVQSNGEDIAPFEELLSQLEGMYDNLEIKCISDAPKGELNTAAPYEKYYLPLVAKLSGNSKALEALETAVESAEKEVIERTSQNFFESLTGLTRKDWAAADKKKRFECIVKLGDYDIQKSIILCVDFSESIPFCDAIVIFIYAYFEYESKKVMIDAGDDTDPKPLLNALRIVSECDDDCIFNVANPLFVTVCGGKIGKPGTLSDRPNPAPADASKYAGEPKGCDPPKQSESDPPKQSESDPPKQSESDPPKQSESDPPKQSESDPLGWRGFFSRLFKRRS